VTNIGVCTHDRPWHLCSTCAQQQPQMAQISIIQAANRATQEAETNFSQAVPDSVASVIRAHGETATGN
jgi:hypothetical protein